MALLKASRRSLGGTGGAVAQPLVIAQSESALVQISAVSLDETDSRWYVFHFAVIADQGH